MRQASSADVSTFLKVAGWRAIAASSPSAVASLKQRVCCSVGHAGSASRSSATSRASHSAWLTCAFWMIWVSSLARSMGMVPTAIPPALMTPNQQAANIGLLGARSSTRLPGTRPISLTSTFATRLARSASAA